ncbi:ribonuclease P protein component [Terracoccus luteus]|uniref:Ribonuclease P protein component n=1 Tax=Terracoccus luteus TaxID=53356 RepID=A0A839PX10_9MICO|nr:ribonuclease P protein component [Terracoccus luteus]MCP2172915.1 ribonuclease P protein component [Terracoccus luteus]
MVRNRTRRRLRAATTSRLTGIPHGVDVVVRANPASARAGWDELDASLATQLESAVRKLEQRTRAAGPATSRTTSPDGRAATGPAG